MKILFVIIMHIVLKTEKGKAKDGIAKGSGQQKDRKRIEKGKKMDDIVSKNLSFVLFSILFCMIAIRSLSFCDPIQI